MVKSTFLKSWLLLLCMLVGSSAAWADETYSLTPDQASTGSTSTSYITSLTEFTYGGISWKMNQWNPKTLQVKTNQSSAASEFRFYNTSAFSGRITKVVISFEALTVSDASKLMFLGGTSEVTATTGGTAGTWDATKKTLTWTPAAADNFTYFAFYQNGRAASGTNYLAETDAIVVTYESSSSATLTGITLSGSYPTTFTEGDAFSHEGMTVTANYDDNSSKDVTGSATFSGYDKSATGSQTVTVSYTEGGVTETATYNITVKALPTHTVTWSVNGSTTQESYKEGASITFPANPGDINDKKFMGWVSTAISGTTNDAPTFVTSATMGTEDVTYYAVFATVTGSISNKTDVLDREFTGVPAAQNYKDWSDKEGVSGAKYAGNSAGGSDTKPCIQLRSNNSNSGVITTTSGGKAKSITITWDSDTQSGRTLNIYGKNSAYTAVSELYNNNNQGTLLGTFAYGSQATATLTITDDYEYIGFRSASGALYLEKVEIVWESGSGSCSDYCTTVAADNRAEAELAFSTDVVNATMGVDPELPTLTTASGFNGTVEYSSSDESVAQVMDTETGELRIIAEGTTTITASFAGNNDFKAGSASYTLNVTDNRTATTITQDNIVLDIADVNTLTQLAPVVKDANNNVVAYNNSGNLPEVYFNCDNDENGIIGSLDGNGAITLNSVLGTATITATYNHFNENATYKPSSCTFTITVESVLSIADARAQTTGDVTTKGVVTSVNGKTAYIQDATAAIVVFGTSNLTCVVGDEIKVSGTLTDYNGLLEIKNPTYTVLSQNNTVNPEVMTVADINTSTNQGWLVKIENATVKTISDKNVTIEQSGEEIVVRFNSTNDISFAVNDVITLTGNIGYYNANQIANPTDVTVAANTTPSIDAENVNIASDATSGSIDFTISNEAADGVMTAATTETWLTIGTVTGTTVPFTTTANDVASARTATVTLTYSYNNGTENVTKDVTVTQAAYVAPDPTIDPAVAGVGAFVKVTNDADLTAGQYLIVYEEGSAAFNGNLETLDAVSNTIGVTISDGKIASTAAAVAATFTIQPTSGRLKSNKGHYIGTSSKNNSLMQSDNADTYKNTFSIDAEGNAVIFADYDESVMYLRFNKAINQDRFRYYKNASQDAIALYKYDATAVAPTTVPVTVTAVGYATFCSDVALDFSNVSGLTAYRATIANNEVKFTEVGEVPAGQGVLLKGENTTDEIYNVPVLSSASQIDNAFVGVLKRTTVTDTGIFVLMNGDKGVGFYKTKDTFTVGAHTAYLPASVAPTRDFIGFGDDISTGISGELRVKSDATVYNLNGQRVNNAQKGLYIVNGRKVVIK